MCGDLSGEAHPKNIPERQFSETMGDRYLLMDLKGL